MGKSDQFQIYDFTADCWAQLDSLDPGNPDSADQVPKICLDLWFDVDDDNIHRVVRLLPDLDWDGELIGLRMVYGAKDSSAMLTRYQIARAATCPPSNSNEDRATGYRPWPQTLTEYLEKRLTDEFEITYHALDERRCDGRRVPLPDYTPYFLGSRQSGAGEIVSSLIKVDFLDAQRHLADSESSGRSGDQPRGRAENLSSRLGRFYRRNLPQFETDLAALGAIANTESALNDHLGEVFEPILRGIGELGYPGAAHPELLLKASFSPAQIFSGSARVHYALPGADAGPSGGSLATLPDQYNGLGFKNLIYMAVEILDFHNAWATSPDDRQPVHLIMIEEPEAHLHAQLQQVFIRKVFALLPPPDRGFQTQMVVTTHSSHLLYESSFSPIRYFSRASISGPLACSEIKDLSVFDQRQEATTREFLQRYVKLTHCDLFFADAVVLVEGNVERLLLPLIIERNFPELRSVHLTILEVGGAFAHIFEGLLAFLSIPALIITDLDSVKPPPAKKPINAAQAVPPIRDGTSCLTNYPGAVTSNETLKHWLEKSPTVTDLLDCPEADKVIKLDGQSEGNIRLAYQTRCDVMWSGLTAKLAGRTLEEAFALQNLVWTQDPERKNLGLHIRKGHTWTLEEMHVRIFNRVRNLDKTAFALHLMADASLEWVAPQYILDGLAWLRDRLQVPAPVLAQVETVASPEMTDVSGVRP
ncbi:hypothetical protein BOX37_08365 [Nocardia mangyaensis]|uniref:Uncharacterized protein n=1 Tax=Nocardia mangyaensis TaxID=2213200 RepID=A0A1J0W1R0_9NOCA|nr:hypothetical protein BOX37_08365 [Nocardia mangyaensis]